MQTVYQLWQEYSDQYKLQPGCSVVGRVILGPVFSLRQDGIYRSYPPKGKQPASYRLATQDELADLDRAITGGCFQIELQPHTGIFRGQASKGSIASYAYRVKVLYQATGHPA